MPVTAWDGDSSYIKGGTDDTQIGNTGNRLLVDASFTNTPTVSPSELKTHVAFASGVATAQNKSMLSLVNAGGSSVVIKIREIWLINVQNTAVTGVVANFELRRITGHSAGTAVTTGSHDLNDTLNASVTALTGSTVSGEGTTVYRRWAWSTDEWAQGAQDVESMDHTMQSLKPHFYQPPFTKGLVLRAGQGMTLKQTINSTTGLFDVAFVFTEE